MKVLITGNAEVDRVIVGATIKCYSAMASGRKRAASLHALSVRLRARGSQAGKRARERLRRLKRAAGRIGGRVF